MEDLDNLLKAIREDPARYTIIDNNLDYTSARLTRKFGLDMSTVHTWASRNQISVRRIPHLNNLKLLRMDYTTLTKLKRFDIISILQREDSLKHFYKIVKMINSVEWVEKVCEVIDSCEDYDERYKLIESLEKKIRESKFETLKPGEKK